MAVRLSSGAHRGKIHQEIRPTAGRTLESVFSMLGEEIFGKRVLDLFSGVGSYGVMSLRKGAESAVFVDSSREAEKRVLRALQQYHLQEQAFVFREEVAHFLHRAEREGRQYDVIFADPPYQTVLPAPIIEAILDARVLVDNGVLVFEHSSHQAPPHMERLVLRKSRVFGDTSVSIWDLT